MRFENEFEGKFRDVVHLVNGLRALSLNCLRHLSAVIKNEKHGDDHFYVTAREFTQINADCLDCIKNTIQSGHIAGALVLLRWHLEMSHLFYYLQENRVKYEDWLSGESIRPKDIGKFFENNGLESCREGYIDWSNVTHYNASYVEMAHIVSQQSPRSSDLVVIAGNALRDLLYVGHKTNSVSLGVLRPVLETNVYGQMTKEDEDLDRSISEFREHQNREHEDMMERDR